MKPGKSILTVEEERDVNQDCEIQQGRCRKTPKR